MLVQAVFRTNQFLIFDRSFCDACGRIFAQDFAFQIHQAFHANQFQKKINNQYKLRRFLVDGRTKGQELGERNVSICVFV